MLIFLLKVVFTIIMIMVVGIMPLPASSKNPFVPNLWILGYYILIAAVVIGLVWTVTP